MNKTEITVYYYTLYGVRDMSMLEYEMGLDFSDCKNCNGQGFIVFSDLPFKTQRKVCEAKNFYLLITEPNRAICCLCNGTGKIKDKRLELIK